jgi:hypothetical protein
MMVTAFKPSIVSYRGKYALHGHNLEHEYTMLANFEVVYEDRSRDVSSCLCC